MKAVVAYFKMLLRHSVEESEEDTETSVRNVGSPTVILNTSWEYFQPHRSLDRRQMWFLNVKAFGSRE